MSKEIGICQRCGNERIIVRRDRCNACCVRENYEARPEAPCARCDKMRKPFVRDLCKSCYQTLRKRPDASLVGSSEFRARVSEALKGLQVREKSPRWKGGSFIAPDGYVRVIDPAVIGGANCSNRYRLEHRVVAEKKIGRKLQSGEVVHHINGVRNDNRPENLQILPSVSAHRKLHVEEEREQRYWGKITMDLLGAHPH